LIAGATALPKRSRRGTRAQSAISNQSSRQPRPSAMPRCADHQARRYREPQPVRSRRFILRRTASTTVSYDIIPD